MANYCFAAPILPGGEERIRRFIREESIENRGHDRVMRELGIHQKQVWLQCSPCGDVMAVVLIDTDCPKTTFEKLSVSNDPWAAKFRQLLFDAYGINVRRGVLINQQVEDWCEHIRNRVTEDKNAVL